MSIIDHMRTMPAQVGPNTRGRRIWVHYAAPDNRAVINASMSDKTLYKIVFMSQGQVYEIYARNVSHGGLFGFIEVEKLVFGERSSVVVDPSEEKIKSEFENVKRTLPAHAFDYPYRRGRQAGHVEDFEGGRQRDSVPDTDLHPLRHQVTTPQKNTPLVSTSAGVHTVYSLSGI